MNMPNRSRILLLITLALLLVLPALTSCGPVMARADSEPIWKAWRPRHASGKWLRKGGLRARMVLAEQERRVPVEGGPVMTGRLVGFDIINDVGAVFIDCSERHAETTVSAYIRFEGRHRLAANQEGWKYDHKGPWFKAEFERGPETGIVRITPTDKTLEDGTRPFVDLVIRTPVCDGLTIRNRFGGVEARGVGGEIKIDSDGDVDFKTNRPTVEEITITSVQGNVTVIAPPESAGTFLISAPEGMAQFDAQWGKTVHSRPRPGEWTGIYNHGPNAITLTSQQGNAGFIVDDNPQMHTHRYRFP